jgi:hypothetical protein
LEPFQRVSLTYTEMQSLLSLVNKARKAVGLHPYRFTEGGRLRPGPAIPKCRDCGRTTEGVKAWTRGTTGRNVTRCGACLVDRAVKGQRQTQTA